MITARLPRCLKLTLPLLCLLLAFSAKGGEAPAKPESISAIFAEGNKKYEKADYLGAIEEYEKILQGGVASGQLYLNLGNAQLKADQKGQSIVSYQRGLRISPRDEALATNLDLAQESLPKFRRNQFQRTLSRVTAKELTWGTAAVGWIWLMGLIAREWRPAWRPKLMKLIWVSGLLFLVLTVLVVLNAGEAKRRAISIVIQPQTVLRKGPLLESPVTISLPEGAEIRVLRELDASAEWVEGMTPSGEIGWVESKRLEKI